MKSQGILVNVPQETEMDKRLTQAKINIQLNQSQCRTPLNYEGNERKFINKEKRKGNVRFTFKKNLYQQPKFKKEFLKLRQKEYEDEGKNNQQIFSHEKNYLTFRSQENGEHEDKKTKNQTKAKNQKTKIKANRKNIQKKKSKTNKKPVKETPKGKRKGRGKGKGKGKEKKKEKPKEKEKEKGKKYLSLISRSLLSEKVHQQKIESEMKKVVYLGIKKPPNSPEIRKEFKSELKAMESIQRNGKKSENKSNDSPLPPSILIPWDKIALKKSTQDNNICNNLFDTNQINQLVEYIKKTESKNDINLNVFRVLVKQQLLLSQIEYLKIFVAYQLDSITENALIPIFDKHRKHPPPLINQEIIQSQVDKIVNSFIVSKNNNKLTPALESQHTHGVAFQTELKKNSSWNFGIGNQIDSDLTIKKDNGWNFFNNTNKSNDDNYNKDTNKFISKPESRFEPRNRKVENNFFNRERNSNWNDEKGKNNWNAEKGNNWSRKGDDWNRRGDDWGGKRDDWDKKRNNNWNAEKGNDWDGKGNDWDRKGDDWSRKVGDHGRKRNNNWNAEKGNNWDRKGNDWNRKGDDRGRKGDDSDVTGNDWKIQGDGWDEKMSNWNLGTNENNNVKNKSENSFMRNRYNTTHLSKHSDWHQDQNNNSYNSSPKKSPTKINSYKYEHHYSPRKRFNKYNSSFRGNGYKGRHRNDYFGRGGYRNKYEKK
ncbi:hypothetical protein M0812_29918 [Anaeramoeba flamelloides]|uniref:Uncharacterized protein n=1 Tax=Anaeramoeba flamelloides TaxID=1746091 RepID=A0AAV7Y1K0_9EUKA|nr:hypothetical protein M0812_29918 [Anaeramoeba flamelloides]